MFDKTKYPIQKIDSENNFILGFNPETLELIIKPYDRAKVAYVNEKGTVIKLNVPITSVNHHWLTVKLGVSKESRK